MPRQVTITALLLYCFTALLVFFVFFGLTVLGFPHAPYFMKRVTIVISDELHQRLKIRCALKADTINSRLIKLIQADLDSTKD